MARLYVNLDHVATVREARGTPYPDVLEAALQAEASGYVDGITLHLREDRRHVNDADMQRVREHVRLPFNFEMSVAPDIVSRCLEVSPHQATLVPERREELTTEGGLDVLGPSGQRIQEVIGKLSDAGILVSLFIDPDPEAIDRSKALGASHIELHTGRYAESAAPNDQARELEALVRGAARASELGLIVNAGHGLTVNNVPPIATIPRMNDLNIGHAIVARAIFLGLTGALEEISLAIRTVG